MDENNLQVLYIVLISIVIALVLICLIFSILANHNARKAKKALKDTSLKLAADVTYDSDNFGECLKITVYNSNFRDIVLHDFGFKYKNQMVSFIDEFAERKATKGKVVVPSRSSITYKVNPERLERFVVSHNFNASSIDTIYLFAVDSIGVSASCKDKELTKVFIARQKARLKLAKRKLHDEKVEKYKQEHDGNIPISDSFYRAFHKKEIKIPEIRAKANSFIPDKTKTPSNMNTSNYNYSSPSNLKDPDIDTSRYNGEEFGERKMDTKDMKVTFLDLDMPLKSKDVSDNKK